MKNKSLPQGGPGCVADPGRITIAFQQLSVSKHFFLIFTEYFFGALDYFAACGKVCALRTGCPRCLPLYAASDR
ncbi:hypothetical protein EVC45_40150 [Paraburkholderia sp. UYCP14C]|uniref:hypothetical protein n=1 Tax=Paraburkholderia sp. UYCP14C TaxID=2511130 RepID=UPI001021A349|nr:hypothetical protein [Paraburkholderia sp. UYCP14C]RZF24171.1 hypothetical protein EVC45_40150 [Paraburkholderia sp. UYCP14C]